MKIAFPLARLLDHELVVAFSLVNNKTATGGVFWAELVEQAFADLSVLDEVRGNAFAHPQHVYSRGHINATFQHGCRDVRSVACLSLRTALVRLILLKFQVRHVPLRQLRIEFGMVEERRRRTHLYSRGNFSRQIQHGWALLEARHGRSSGT